MSAIRMLSGKLLEPTTTVPLSAVFSASGSDVSSEEEEHPASRAVAAASARAATPGRRLRGLLCAALEFTISVPDSGDCSEALGLIQSSGFLVSQEQPGHQLASMPDRL